MERVKNIAIIPHNSWDLLIGCKQYLLYFDEISYDDLEYTLPTHTFSKDFTKLEPLNISEERWKAENRAINAMIKIRLDSLKNNNLLHQLSINPDDYKENMDAVLAQPGVTESIMNARKIYGVDFIDYGVFTARFQAIYSNYVQNQTNYFPLINDLSSLNANTESKSKVVNIVINSMPIVHPNTPFEHIIEFKQNEENYNKFLNLRNWINEISNSNLSVTEIKEKIEHLINEYEKYMKIHKIKFERGIMKTSVVATAEALENVAKLEFSKLAKKAFSLTEQNADLLIAELDAPGRELSYIIEANKKFKPK